MLHARALGMTLLLAALAGVGAFFATRGAKAAEGLVVTPNPMLFGEVRLPDQKEMEVTLENRGQRDLMLKDPTFSCACFILATRPSSLLRPGGKTTFRVVIDPTKTDPRPFNKKMTIVSDDPLSPQIEVPISGEVVEYRRWSRPRADFHAVDLAKGADPQRFEMRSGVGFSAKAVQAVSSDPRFSVEIVPAEGGSDIVVKPQAAAGLKAGHVDAQIAVSLVVTGHGKAPTQLTDTVWVSADLK